MLQITMNYLSNTVYLSIQKSMDTKSRAAVEKVFLFITSTIRDSFLSSLKRIKSADLRYFEEADIISPQVRNECDKLGYSLRLLLKMIAGGTFARQDGLMMKDTLKDEDQFKEYLSQYTPMERARLGDIVLRILSFIEKKCEENQDYKVALVKESIPLALIALADYIGEYFGSQV